MSVAGACQLQCASTGIDAALLCNTNTQEQIGLAGTAKHHTLKAGSKGGAASGPAAAAADGDGMMTE